MPRAHLMIFGFLLCGIFLPRAAHTAWPTDPTVNLPVCVAAGDQWHPRMVSDGAGGGVASWTDRRSGVNTDIYVQRVDVSGTPLWTLDGVALCTATGDQLHQSIASDGAGGAFVTWHDLRSGLGQVYAQRVSSMGAPLWTANGIVVCSVSGLADYSYPHVVPDGAGGALVAWEDVRSGSGRKAYIQRLDASGLPLWTVNGVEVCTSSSLQQCLDLASDGDGGALVSWTAGSLGFRDIRAQQLSATGLRQWPDTGVVVSPRTSGMDNPGANSAIATDMTGGALIAWGDRREGTCRVYAQRLGATGAEQWTANGVALGAATNDQSDLSMVPDGSGGAVLIWLDSRAGGVAAYGQRVNSAGTALWTSDGMALGPVYEAFDCGGDPDSCQWMPPSVVLDGLGGAVATWWGNVPNDVYAQRVDPNGALQWGTNGVAICAASGNQVMPTITLDGCGGAIVVWDDLRNGNWDIYAQEVGHGGQLAGVPGTTPGATRALRLGQPTPNPCSGGASISYALPVAGPATLVVCDLQGRLVRVLARGTLPAGEESARWDGRDEAGCPARTGLYFIRLDSGGHKLIAKLIAIH